MYLVKNVKITLASDYDLREAVSIKFGLKSGQIGDIEILRKALDARKRNRLKLNFTLLISELPEISHPDLLHYSEPLPYISSKKKLSDPQPLIVGAGPAGLFAALGLVERGFKPIIFDRGEMLENRTKKVSEFWQKGVLDEESNVQFGEGGAGTFSDGKLTSRNRDFYSSKIFSELIKFGASLNIKYEALPHLGTDKLRIIIKNIRNYLINNGCTFHWNHKLENITIENNRIKNIRINGISYKPEILILATGNAARETFEMLDKINAVTSKPFAVGVRIEHPQNFINASFYGNKTDLSLTGPATYRLTSNKGKKGIYSFCMCPGGFIIGASTEKNHLTINGMSFSDRSNYYANSAIVVSVSQEDIGTGALAGVDFQQKIESQCFNFSKNYFAPAQSAADFINGDKSSEKITTSYNPGVNPIDINNCLPELLSADLKFGLDQFDKRVPGFIENGILIAPETRTSSPVRIIRDNVNYSSIAADNLYPAGEGSGYAGGIISSAVDGYKISQLFSL
jgi:uncharacterized protein